MSRVQLALNVENIDEAVEFYARLFGTEPAKRRPGYANFAVVDPPLKLVLIEGDPELSGTINHLGVEVASAEDVTMAGARLAQSGLSTASEEDVTCCFARQDKVWAASPDGVAWEFYTVLADADSMGADLGPIRPDGSACCTGAAGLAAGPAGATRDAAACC